MSLTLKKTSYHNFEERAVKFVSRILLIEFKRILNEV